MNLQVEGAIVRKGRVIPFGYKVSNEDKKVLLPEPKEQEAVRRILEYHKQGYTYRSILEWVYRATGRKLSLHGLEHIIKKRKY